MDRKNSSKFVIIFMGSLFVISVVISLIMISNYSKDSNKERAKLTKEHKEALKQDYVYDQARGESIYGKFCLRCHGAEGAGGMSGPPLEQSPLVNGKTDSLIKLVVHGMKGRIERNGRVYDMLMPGFKMIANEDLAHVLTYVKNNFGNDGGEISLVEVLETRIGTVERQGPFEVSELE